MSNLSIDKLSNDTIVDLFEKAFEEKIAKYLDIPSFEVECNRRFPEKSVIVKVTIYGTAGCPTIDDFKKETDKVKSAKEVTISREDIGEVKFTLQTQDTVFLNSNEYDLFYKN